MNWRKYLKDRPADSLVLPKEDIGQCVDDNYATDIISYDPRTQFAYERYCIFLRDELFVYKYPCYKWSREDD